VGQGVKCPGIGSTVSL